VSDFVTDTSIGGWSSAEATDMNLEVDNTIADDYGLWNRFCLKTNNEFEI